MSQTGDKPDRGSTYRTPRWVKVFGIITLIVVLVIVVILVTGLGGPHGPRRHGLVQPPVSSFQLPVSDGPPLSAISLPLTALDSILTQHLAWNETWQSDLGLEAYGLQLEA